MPPAAAPPAAALPAEASPAGDSSTASARTAKPSPPPATDSIGKGPAPVKTAAKTEAVSSAEAESAAAPAGASDSAVTFDDFLNIRLGSTLEQVNETVGMKGSLKSANEVSALYTWESPVPGYRYTKEIMVLFHNGKALSKRQFGMNIDYSVALTTRKYEQVSEGMTYEQVKSILGEGRLWIVETSGGVGEKMTYEWRTRYENEPYDAYALVQFHKGKVAKKTSYRLAASSRGTVGGNFTADWAERGFLYVDEDGVERVEQDLKTANLASADGWIYEYYGDY